MKDTAHLSEGPEATRALAREFAACLQGGEVVLLLGDLGLGKTCFVQGLAEGLGWQGAVVSPTFALIQEYDTSPPLAHADLYRLENSATVYALGIDELTDAGYVLAVEWPSRAPNAWPEDAWRVELKAVPGEDDQRMIQISKGGLACP
jgi:tRNA threonylcarbamoyladenosine biosynthesis protein TsaE